jgi:dihydroflavonol-4-reductase
MILVTGSSGHIGNVLVRKLIERGERIRVMTKTGEKPEWLSHLELEVVKGDLRHADEVNSAVKGVKYVFHLAGIISISSFDSKELNDVNVQGTQHVLDACIAHGVERLVYTSSVHALPEGTHGIPITEESDFNGQDLFGAYARTKAAATKKVFESVEKGLDAVVCFPSGVMGPHDYRGSEAGRLIRDYASNKLPVYIDGEYNFVDVRDVVDGLILAWEKGRKGEGYILAGERMSLNQFFDILSGYESRMRKPKMKIPLPIAIGSAWVLESVCRVIKAKPMFTVYAIKVLQSNCDIPSEKAQRELGYTFRPMNESIRDGLHWLKENSKIK